MGFQVLCILILCTYTYEIFFSVHIDVLVLLEGFSGYNVWQKQECYRGAAVPGRTGGVGKAAVAAQPRRGPRPCRRCCPVQHPQFTQRNLQKTCLKCKTCFLYHPSLRCTF